MARRFRGRLSPREERAQINASHSYIASLCTDPKKAAEYRDKFVKELPPKRHKVKRPVDGKPAAPYERDVLVQIIKSLRRDPRVSRVERNQSGVFREGSRFIRVGTPGKLDLTVYLRSGAYAEIEVKRDAKTKPDAHQLERIAAIKRDGGIAGWAWSAESALAIIP